MNNYFMETHHHEWILTNKLGGYALGTGNLINQRKYHGLLVAGNKNFNRTHLVAGIEEEVEWRGEIIHLDSNNYSNCIYPEGFLYLVKPWLRPYPIFLYSALPHQNDILIRKEILMDENSNTVVIRYTNLGHHKLHFGFHPKYSMHNHHDLNQPGSLDYESFETQITNDDSGCCFRARRLSNNVDVYGYAFEAEVIENRFVYYNIFYPWDAMKGYSGVGDQVTLFEVRFDLKAGEQKFLVFSDQPLKNVEHTIKTVTERYAELPLPHDYPHEPDNDDTLLSGIDFNDGLLFNYKEYLPILDFALRDFIRDDDIVSGYPWYVSTSPDTMFFLNSILNNPGMREIAVRIIDKYKRVLNDGLLPYNPDEHIGENNPVSLEASLLMVAVLDKLAQFNIDAPTSAETIRIIEQILFAIMDNKTYPFNLREDGLIELQEDYAHATWMNAMQDGRPITPRKGAPIEINALWYNAISLYGEMCSRSAKNKKEKHVPVKSLIAIKDKVAESMQKFWIDEYLADRLVGDEPVIEIRSNALLAVALPHTPFSPEHQEAIFKKIQRILYILWNSHS
jgi:predicted glycogen debranching enzyme